jgi:hypothetical protein
MKNKICYIILIFSSLLIVSCESFLEEENRSSLDNESFFASADDAFSAVNNLYRSGLPSFYNAGSAYMGPVIMYGGYLSGLFENQYKGQEKFVQDAQSLTIHPVTSSSELLNIWRECYSAIARANTAISYIPDTPGLIEGETSQLLAEARFFRSLNYFHLIKMFGRVPLVTEPTESLDSLYVSQAEVADIYDFIVEDLTSAIDEGGLADTPMPENGFRVSKGSVQALLADVYLNMSGDPVNADHYADAAAVAGSLINNGAYELIQGTGEETPYDILRTSDNEKEYLYVIEYNEDIADGGWRPIYSFPNEAAAWGEFTYSITNLAYYPVNQIFAAYDTENDLRAQEKQYFHTEYTFTKGNREGETVQLSIRSPYFWFEPDALYVTNRSQKDQVHYRLAEMYLIAAEAIAQSDGVTAEAAGYLAAIQARASLNQTEAQIRTQLMTLSSENFIQEVWRERIRELMFENKIWYDITRTRQYPSSSGGQFSFMSFVGATNPWGKVFAEKNLLLPIPDDELQRNPNLEQNTGY